MKLTKNEAKVLIASILVGPTRSALLSRLPAEEMQKIADVLEKNLTAYVRQGQAPAPTMTNGSTSPKR